ncbi:putative metal-binding motif-containing protein, partial [Thermodesulfobacteriota bacterium]
MDISDSPCVFIIDHHERGHMSMNTRFFYFHWKSLILMLFICFAFIHPTSAQAFDGPVIDVWYGSEQTFGEIGLPQRWVSILGNVSDPDGVSSLSYSLNGGIALPLSMGPFRRLDKEGDFNVELDFAELIDGPNQLVITATDTLNNVTEENVTITFEAGNLWPMPYFTNWGAIDHIQDAAQIVDGLWTLEGDSVRPVQLGYDRILAIGDIQWTDFEVVVPITIHGIDPGGFDWPSVAPAVATTLRWQGHEAWDDSQPRWGYYPIGAGPWYEFNEDGSGSLSLKGDYWSTGDPASRVLAYEVCYLWKTRVQTMPSGVSQYSFKLWEDGLPEPEEWDITGQEEDDLPAGSLLLIAHEVDASFGDVSIAPILEISDVQVTHGETDAIIAWKSNVPATSRVDYGLTDSYELGYVEEATLVTQHGIPLNGLTSGLVYHYRVSSTIVEGLESSRTGQFRAGLSSIESDDFHSPGLNTDLWEFIDPLEDTTLTMTGTQAQISIPATGVAHNAWTDVYTVPRLLQYLEDDADFEVEAKFESLITAHPQMHGITVEQDESNFLRVEFQHRSGNFRVFAASIFGGSSQIHTAQTISQDVPMYLQVRRLLDFWSVLYSYDGNFWVTACTFTQEMTVTAVGVYAGNGPSTPHTVLIDYFFDAASPIDPEDGVEEICGNGIDDDGDDIIDNRDIDEDGYIDDACGGVDCDDTDPDVNPDGTEICDGIDNNCTDGVDEEPLASAFCDNDFFCDGEEYCSAGSCQAGSPPDCGDGVGCTVDTCNEATDSCDHAADDSLCDDGLWCNGVETCDEVLDCQAGAAPCPDDGLWCNGAESCDEAGDQCTSTGDPCP